MKDFKNKKQQVITQRNNSKQLPPPLREVTQKGGGSKDHTHNKNKIVMLNLFQHLTHEKGLGWSYQCQTLKLVQGDIKKIINPSTRNAAFTLTGGRRPLLNSGYRRAAFTLAEVLITLAVIGIVAALTLPTLMNNINERIYSQRQANIAYKITQATNKMQALGLLNGNYSSTDAFVDELQKHLKIVKRCNASNITECWPTDKVMTSDGKEFDVSKAKTGKNLNIEENTTDNVGLVLADGASIILTYNQNSPGIYVGDAITAQYMTLPVGFGKSKNFAYTTNTTNAIDFIMDVNGRKGPNSETRDNKFNDIRSFRVAKFSKGCAGIEVADIGCVVNLGNTYDCISEEPFMDNDNCWAGAKQACAAIGMKLPDSDTLQSIAPDIPFSFPLYGFWSSSEPNDQLAECVVKDGFMLLTKDEKLSDTLCVEN